MHTPEDRERLEICQAWVQKALVPLGCNFSGWFAEVLTIKSWHHYVKLMHFSVPPFQAELYRLGESNDNIVDTLSPVIAHLATGQRNSKAEYRVIAMVYDQFGGVHDMGELRSYLNNLFEEVSKSFAVTKHFERAVQR